MPEAILHYILFVRMRAYCRDLTTYLDSAPEPTIGGSDKFICDSEPKSASEAYKDGVRFYFC